jgi:hypothetical protein
MVASFPSIGKTNCWILFGAIEKFFMLSIDFCTSLENALKLSSVIPVFICEAVNPFKAYINIVV